MAIVANLTPTGVPAGDTIGGTPMKLYHVTVTPASGPGTYTFNHGLPYTPTCAIIIPENTEGTTPAQIASFCVGDTNATVLALNVLVNGTLDVIYG